MAEILTLSASQTFPSVTMWKVEDIYLSVASPAMKVTLVSNTGERYVYRYTPSETVTEAQVLTGLSFINQGKFMTLQSKSLQKWLLDKISADGVKVGVVIGSAD